MTSVISGDVQFRDGIAVCVLPDRGEEFMRQLIHLAMLLLVLPFAVAQTEVQRVCNAVKDPYSPQCVLVNGMPQTTTVAPKQPPPVVPTWTPPTPAQTQNVNVQQNVKVQQSVPATTTPAAFPAPAQSTTVYQNQSVTVNNGPSAYDRYLAERDRQNAAAGQAMGNAIGTGIAASIENHRARHFVKKFCKQNGPGATWWYQFQGQPQITGTCGDSDVVRQGDAGRSEAAANSWHTEAYCEKDGSVWRDNSCHSRDVVRQRESERSEAVATSWHTEAYCEKDGFVWRDNSCHLR
jgi:hypothetical protein